MHVRLKPNIFFLVIDSLRQDKCQRSQVDECGGFCWFTNGSSSCRGFESH